MSERDAKSGTQDGGDARPKLTPAAERALAEAEARRKQQAQQDRETAAQACEEGGPSGPEPTRFGDWERKGIAYDF